MTNFKKARLAKDLSQKEIAVILKVAQPTVSAWEAGRKTPSGKNLKRLCELLGVSVDYLLGIDSNCELSLAMSDLSDNPAPIYVNNLRHLRKAKQISQEILAKDLNVAQNTISQWELGIRDIDSSTLQVLADYFDVSIDYLLGNGNAPALPDEKKEPIPEIGSYEWLRQGLIARGIMKDGEDITDEQLKIMLVNLDSIAQIFNKKDEK